MTFRIKDGKEVNLQYEVNLPEDEFLKMLSDIEILQALVQGADAVLRHMLEENPPLFAAIIQKFLILNLAQQESLTEVQKWANNVIKELWALKFGGIEGGA